MTGRWRQRARGLAAACALVLASLFAWIEPAGAHASLVRAEPADGAVLPVAPDRLRLSFNEPVAPLVLKLFGADGMATTLDRVEQQGATIAVPVPAGLDHGTYVLSWRVVSEDGHPVAGSSVFSIGAPGAGAATVVPATDRPVQVAIWAVRVLAYAGLFLGAGGMFFRAWTAGGALPGRRFVAGMTTAGLVALPLAVGLQGLDALGLPLGALSDAAVWRTALSTSYAMTAAAGMVALVASLAAAFARHDLLRRALSLAGLLGVGVALSASGHAATADPEWLMRPVVFLHAVGIAFWTGALVPLALHLARRTPDVTVVLRRFSQWIPFALLPMLCAGLVLALVQLGTPAALVDTPYGRVLLAKLALVALLFGLAAVNRWRLTAGADRGEPRARRLLVAVIVAETLVVGGILGVAALWRFTPPPRALMLARAAPAHLHIHTGKAMADVTVDPGRVGRATVSIAVLTGDFAALPAKEVTLILANPSVGIEPLRRNAVPTAEGGWRVDDLAIPVPGRWSVALEILVSDFEAVTLEDTIEIAP